MDEESIYDNQNVALTVGYIVKGTVVNVLRHYAIVKVGTLDCVLPNSELSWGKTKEGVAVGTAIKALVVRIEGSQVMLSIKRLSDNPWSNVDSLYKIGDHTKGRVVNIKNFGVIVELSSGLSALLHKSQIELKPNLTIKDIFHIDDVLELEILTIDADAKKISVKTIN